MQTKPSGHPQHLDPLDACDEPALARARHTHLDKMKYSPGLYPSVWKPSLKVEIQVFFHAAPTCRNMGGPVEDEMME